MLTKTTIEELRKAVAKDPQLEKAGGREVALFMCEQLDNISHQLTRLANAAEEASK